MVKTGGQIISARGLKLSAGKFYRGWTINLIELIHDFSTTDLQMTTALDPPALKVEMMAALEPPGLKVEMTLAAFSDV